MPNHGRTAYGCYADRRLGAFDRLVDRHEPAALGALVDRHGGAALAIVVGKQVYSGLGQNLFNLAMLARVALLVSFPLEMTTWIPPLPLFFSAAPGLLDSLSITFGGASVDGFSGASLLVGESFA